MDFCGARDYIIQRLRSELKPTLYYHCVEHTLDVYEATRRLIEAEKIEEKYIPLIETAALFHDAGILVQYFDHEKASAIIAKTILPGFGYTAFEIDWISGLIMVTRLPQRPGSLAEKILCDADLDYLGRNDFFIHSFQLRLEWQVNGIKNLNLHDWLVTQAAFLSEHQYFTKSAFSLRNEQKNKNLKEVQELLINVSKAQ
ncbi:MAG: HD domain-containing protein [Bacteroidota bacterium]